MIPAGGGCINECFILQTNAGKFFVKHNDASKFPGMLRMEAKGLQLLSEKVNGITPEVIAEYEDRSDLFLILENIEQGKPQKEFWNDFADKLAAIHRHSNEFFGLEHDNFIGSLPQSNRQHSDWISFFILERIEPQLKMSIDNKRLPKGIYRVFEKMFLRLAEIFPSEEPALLHGDLWAGNYLTAGDGSVRLIDPAVYFGFREMDLAMMKLFGGFDPSFLRWYENIFPLEKDFEKRAGICNLYPLLVHVNLFGGHYVSEVNSIIMNFQGR